MMVRDCLRYPKLWPTRTFLFLLLTSTRGQDDAHLLLRPNSYHEFPTYPTFPLVSTKFYSSKSCHVGDDCEQCTHLPTEGDGCATETYVAILYCNSATQEIMMNYTSFLLCNSFGRLEMARCTPNTYFEEGRGCVSPMKRLQRQNAITGSGRVGDVCAFNTDCLSGMYCSGGLCTCLSTYILREGYCYEKVNPNQPGCTYDVQCSAVWPGSRCVSETGVGTCRCQDTHVARETRDGWICVSLKDYSTGSTAPLYFVCPLPEGAGFKLALSDPNTSTYPIGCTTGSSATVESNAENQGAGACIWPSTGEYIGDIYDCIATSPHVNLLEQFPDSNYAPTADGVCCPNRAFTCIQPQVTGPNPTEPRWWYNSVTGTCQQFLWDPTASLSRHHSANNFRTIGHCESYCRDTCARGSPQYTIENKLQSERPLTGCSTSSGCGNEYQCTNVGSTHLCCPTPSVVCSALGGRPFDLHPRSEVFHPGFKTLTGKDSVRFYYDPTVGKCKDFVYNGAGGNYNNFLSRHECEMYCARLQCDRGTPLKIGEESQRCQSNAGCPSTHECKTDQGVCCPRKQTICSQPLRIGDCTENVKRYWYNAQTRQCQMFEFSGCQGNDNNFETILDCQNYCKNAIPEPRCAQGQAYRDAGGNFIQCGQSSHSCPQNYECYFDGNLWGCCPTKAFTCSQSADSGIQCGAGSSFKYFYNVQTQACESFQFNGCDGNSNNFPTRDACERYCGVGGCPNGGSPLRDHSGQIASCNMQDGCMDTHECVAVYVTGSLIHRCCPTKKHICSLPPIQGSLCSTQALTRYYFNIVTGQCTTFQYNGCDGNQNNFITNTQCNNFCMSNACADGDSVYLNPNDQQPITCNEALRNSCPPNYQCTFNSLMNNYVCCGAGAMGVCPDGEKAYMNSYDSTARECVINVEGSCPEKYLCRFNMQRNRYYCCSSVEGKTCPAGKFLFQDIRTSLPIKCTIGSNPSQCPEGYSCQSYLSGAFQGFCCSANTICPDNSDFLVDESSQQPRICTMGDFVSCPNGFVCKSAHSSVEGFCCRGGILGVTDGCPPGDFVHLVQGEIANCDPFNPPNAPCPPGYTCQWSTANQRYQCCGSKAIPPITPKHDGCPREQIAFMDGKSPRVCTAGGRSCPVGYFCQFSSTNNQFQCCGVSGGCPHNQVAFIGVQGEPERCVIGQTTCPFGFTCQKTLHGKDTCCTFQKTEEECKEEQIYVGGLCLERAAPDEPCIGSAQCIGGSLCKDQVCTCPENTVARGKYCQAEVQRCSIRQVQMTDGCYDRVPLGSKCRYSRQCPLTSYCIGQECTCKSGFEPKDGICVSDEKLAHTTAAPTTMKKQSGIKSCANSNLVPYEDVRTRKVMSCSPITDRCPPGYACLLDSSKSHYICCGVPASTVSPIAVSVCPSSRTPYLLNGHPQLCVKTKCPQGYDCVYSGSAYYCCSSGNGFSRLSHGYQGKLNHDGCVRGTPLMFPETQTPVACSPRRRCPIGYFCTKSKQSRQFICCTHYFLNDEPKKGSSCENLNSTVTSRCSSNGNQSSS